MPLCARRVVSSSFTRFALLPTPATTATLHSLLRTHSQPSDHIPSTIAALSAELACHDVESLLIHAQLAALHTHLARVEADRAALAAHHAGCTSLLSPGWWVGRRRALAIPGSHSGAAGNAFLPSSRRADRTVNVAIFADCLSANYRPLVRVTVSVSWFSISYPCIVSADPARTLVRAMK
ncbi:hypothetical protein C8R44DRAFT_882568 [Mycena epipterygia]|nr:hypothetical protein C8R44DRAFT_882568 [Mycena epipterygia]